MEKETKIINWEQEFFEHHIIYHQLREFVSDKMPYVVLVLYHCLDVHASCEQKRDGSKDSFYDELG